MSTAVDTISAFAADRERTYGQAMEMVSKPATQNRMSDEEGNPLPAPSGFKILVRPFTRVKKGSIYLPEKDASLHDIASVCAQVFAVGPDAYPVEKFPSGPFCKPGDWIIFRSYTGTRLKVGEREYRLINDDTVEAVIGDPETVERG